MRKPLIVYESGTETLNVYDCNFDFEFECANAEVPLSTYMSKSSFVTRYEGLLLDTTTIDGAYQNMKSYTSGHVCMKWRKNGLKDFVDIEVVNAQNVNLTKFLYFKMCDISTLLSNAKTYGLSGRGYTFDDYDYYPNVTYTYKPARVLPVDRIYTALDDND